jgi:hypothetical protein
MAKPARLLRPDELGVEGHLQMIRRGGTGGRPPREGEFPDPSDAELVEAGWQRARERPTRSSDGPSAGEQIEVGQLGRRLRVLDGELARTRGSSKVVPTMGQRRPADIRRDIEGVQAEIAAVRAAYAHPPPSAEEKAATKAARKGAAAAALRGGRRP